MYKTYLISGVIHSVDPIFSSRGYARACFGDRIKYVSYEAKGRSLLFNFHRPIVVTEGDDPTRGWLTSDDDRNVDWIVEEVK
jgi:hypothetical protein